MQYLLFVPFWASFTFSAHVDTNNSDVIITYAGHNEADRPLPDKINLYDEKPSDIKNDEKENIKDDITEASDVVFVPNEKEVLRNEDYGHGVHDLIQATNIEGIMKNVNVETETPSQDIIFISGRNNENIEKPAKEVPAPSKTRPKKIKLDCQNLDCNNTVHYICGGKEEDNKWKYRTFLNECYFRKVNCAFQYASNRYRIMSMEKCKSIGGRMASRPLIVSNYLIHNNEKTNETRRNFASRRTLNMGVDGALCSHSCPDHCTDDYDPQCAVSAAGQRRMFLNHCKLDYMSCLFQEVWHRRPLSECVGGKKADMRQNRGFIGWLQRVGIVDKRGKLVLS